MKADYSKIDLFELFLALIVITLALLLVTILDVNHRFLIILCMIIAIGSCGPAWASFGVNHLDIGAQYAPILMGLSNCIGSMPGFLVPLLTGYIVENPSVRKKIREMTHERELFVIFCLICLDKTRMERDLHDFNINFCSGLDVLHIFRLR